MTKDRIEVHAWVADERQAKTITDEQLDQLQSVFEGRLGIERREDGALALYSSDPGTAARLRDLMTTLNIFKEQKIYRDDR